MELIAICGAVLAGRNMLSKPKEKISENPDYGILPPHEDHLSEMRRAGVIVTGHNSVAARVPFNTDRPPFAIWRPSDDEARVNPTEDIYTHISNTTSHHRDDFEAQNRAGSEYFVSKRGGAIPVMFSREIHNIADPSMRTGMVDWSWIPKNPTDADFMRMGALGKALPRHPELFSPDANFMAAPGLTWRHGGNGR
jgi:hypothetical protein